VPASTSCSSRTRQLDLRIVGIRSKQQKGVAEHLSYLALCTLCEILGSIVAIEIRGLADLDLHELVIDEGLIDRGDEPVIDASFADLHHWAKLVAESSKVSSLFSGEHATFYPKSDNVRASAK
jgi:hypothetical protein